MERSSSRTALSVAALRAAHQLLDDEPKILDDPVVLRLLDPRTLDGIRADPGRFREPRAAGLRAHVVVRSRYAEDLLAEAVGRGVRQYVILGAGLDTFAYRQPDWARALRIFEVDHPASQRTKRERLAAAGIEAPANLEHVGIDFESTSLREGLLGSGLDLARPAFFSCLGVLMYLTEPAADAVFSLVASFPRPSALAFTFAPAEGSSDERPGGSTPAIAERAAAAGEPWVTYYRPEDLAARLRGFGFSVVSLLSPTEFAERYLRGRRDGLRAARHASIGSAVVGS